MNIKHFGIDEKCDFKMKGTFPDFENVIKVFSFFKTDHSRSIAMHIAEALLQKTEDGGMGLSTEDVTILLELLSPEKLKATTA